MSFIMDDPEVELIDSYRPGNVAGPLRQTQADVPGEDLVAIPVPGPLGLPSPSIGGQPGSGIRNGYSTGFQSQFTRTQPFRGAMITAPQTRNVVIGEVGRSNRADNLYAGVMDQLTDYKSTLASYAGSYVGVMPGVAS